MTTTNPSPAPAAAVAAANGQPAKKEIRTTDDLWQEAFERSGVRTTLERSPKAGWLGKEVEVGQPSPMNKRMLIIGLFHDDTTIRMYEVPTAEPGQPPPNLAPRRWHLSKTSGSYIMDEMPLDRMADLLAEELSILDMGTTTAERERSAVLRFGQSLPPEYSLRKFLEDVENEEHLEDDDDDDAPDGTS